MLALGLGMGSTHLGLPWGISSSAGVVMVSSSGLAPLLGLRYTRWVFVKVGGENESEGTGKMIISRNLP